MLKIWLSSTIIHIEEDVSALVEAIRPAVEDSECPMTPLEWSRSLSCWEARIRIAQDIATIQQGIAQAVHPTLAGSKLDADGPEP